MFYKIVPFLVWYGAYSRHIGLVKVPALADLYCHRLQAVGYFTYLAGLAVASTGIVLSNGLMVRGGGVIFLASLAGLAVNIAKILSHLVRPRLTPDSVNPSVSPAIGKAIPSSLSMPPLRP